MIVKIFKKFIGILGFKLMDKNHIKNERLLSKYSFFSINRTLKNLFSNNLVNSVIQIGANDGQRFDDLSKFIKKYSPKATLVEPIKKNFEDLKLNYKDQKNINFENSAISVNNEINFLFKVDDNKLSLYGDHIKGITSFNIRHLLKHGVSKPHIKKEQVNSISIKNLLSKYSVTNLDLLMIDAESYDGKIAIDFLTNSILRPIIIFEFIHISHETFKKLINLLDTKDFNFFKIEENMICLPKEFVHNNKIF